MTATPPHTVSGLDGVPVPDAVVVVREEQLRAKTVTVPIGVAVLRKTVVTEMRTISVEVRREEVDFSIRPWTGSDEDASAGAHVALPELVLYEEEIIVTRRLVPRERVRLMVVPVTEMQAVVAEVRREVVDLQTGPDSHEPHRNTRA